MAHNIDSIAYAGQTPWHRLGTRIKGETTRNVKAAMEAAGLNWTVRVENIFRQLTGSLVEVPDARGIIREDTGAYLATVGKRYTPVQNAETFSLLEPLVDMGCSIEVMAALDGGRQTFGLLRMPESRLDVGGGDYVNGYALVVNPHDGSGALQALLTIIRVVCQNTLNMATSRGAKRADIVRLRHSTKVADRVKDAQEVMRQLGEAFAQTGDTFAALAQRKMSPAEVAAYIETALGIDRTDKDAEVSETLEERAATIARLAYFGTGNKTDDGQATAWTAYNAVTEYFDHVRPAEAKSASAKLSAAESALFGANARIKATALETARQLVTA